MNTKAMTHEYVYYNEIIDQLIIFNIFTLWVAEEQRLIYIGMV